MSTDTPLTNNKWLDYEANCMASLLPEDTSDLQESSEMMKYLLFYRTKILWRISDLNHVKTIAELEELPVFSIFHQNDNWYLPIETDDVLMTPNHKNTFFQFPPTKKFLYQQALNEPAETDWVDVSDDKIIWRTIGYQRRLMEYRTKYASFVRPVIDVSSMPYRVDGQDIICYNSIYRVRVMGLLREYRRFNLLIGMMLNNIAKLPDREHFIHIPITSAQFLKSDFIRAFKKFDKTSIKYSESPHYVFMMHLLSFIECDFQATSQSIFNKIPESAWEHVHFIVTAGKKCVVYQLAALKKLNGERNTIFLKLINQLNLLSLFSGEDVVLPESIEKPSEISDEKSSNSSDSDTAVTSSPQPTITDVELDEDFGDKHQIDEREIPIRPNENKPNTQNNGNDGVEPITRQERRTDQQKFDQTAKAKIEKQPGLTLAQKTRAVKLSEQYREIDLDGEKIIDILEKPAVDALPEENLEFLKDDVPEASMTKSTIINFDKSYVDNTMKRDIAATLVSFNRHGMFLTDVKKERTFTQMTRSDVYVAKYEDAQHKNHTIRFTLPVIDENGYCFDNGSLKMLRKQRVTNPICKVSPYQVTLNSYYNKIIVVRNTNVANNFLEKFEKYLEKLSNKIKRSHAAIVYSKKPLPYEYTELGSKYSALTYNNQTTFVFDYDKRFDGIANTVQEQLKELEKKYGVFIGSDHDNAYFQDLECSIYQVVLSSKNSEYIGNFFDLFYKLSGESTPNLFEWVDIKILNKKLPLIFPLAYRFGLTRMLRYTNTNYRLYNAGERFDRSESDIVIKFADKTLVIPRTPLFNSLIFAGLSGMNTEDILYEMLDDKEIYYELITSFGLSVGSIQSIDNFFDLFIDPMTKDLLAELKEPTNIKDLLLRAVSLISTTDYLSPSSSANHRFRTYERIPGIIYKEMSRALAAYRSRTNTGMNKFSISEYAVKQAVMQDKLMINVDIINPIADIKQQCVYTHAGDGGRSAETFMISDRQFTDDSLGIMSEATVDSGDTGMTASMSINPTLTNTRGITTKLELENLNPSNLLSINSMVMPCVTCDDERNFL